MGLQAFERRLEKLVEGAFATAFRSGLQPVEIGRRLVRELDDHRTLGVSGVIVPNHFAISVSPKDHEQIAPFKEALVVELGQALRDHARAEGYRFVGGMSITIEPERRFKTGRLAINSEIVADAGGRVGALVMGNGDRIPLGEHPVVIGRLAECTITINDPQVSRRHAEIRPHAEGFRLIDLGSTNGTTINGTAVRDHHLTDGDVLSFGATTIRFEAS